MKFKIFLQVRSDSKRLPNECFLNIKKSPSILYLCKRIGNYKKYLTVLTTNEKSDAYLRYILKKNRINYYGGSSINVLQRFKNCAAGLSDDTVIIRLTADNLVIDDTLIKNCIKNYLKQKSQYSYLDSIKNNVPYGISLELFKVRLIRMTIPKSKHLEEHVTSHIKFKNTLKIVNDFKNKKMHQLRCTIDYIEDYNFLKGYLEKYSPKTNWKNICNKLKKYKINKKNKFSFKIKKTNELSKSERIKTIKLKDTYWNYGIKSQKSFFLKTYKKNDIHIMLFKNSNLIGYNCLRIFKNNLSKYILLDSFIVRPDFRGKGISDILLSKSLNEIISLNYKTYLYANSNSLSLYKRFGFRNVKKNFLLKKNKKFQMEFIK